MTETTYAINPHPVMGKEFAADWIAALEEMPDLRADQTADTGKYTYTYADLRQTLNLVRPVLARHNMAVHQQVHTTDLGPEVRTIITHKSGQTMLVGELTLPAGGSPQAAGSSITYSRRYSITAALGLAVEDDDGASAVRPPDSRRTSGGQSADMVHTPAGDHFPVVAFTEADRLDDGSWPKPTCPYCRAKVVQETLTKGKAQGKQIWKCTNRDCGGGEPKKDGGRWSWSSWHDDPWKPGGDIDDLVGHTAPPIAEVPAFDAKTYMANAVQAFSEWSPQKRSGQGTSIMAELDIHNPMSEEECKRVLAEMAKRYYAEHPTDEGAPF